MRVLKRVCSLLLIGGTFCFGGDVFAGETEDAILKQQASILEKVEGMPVDDSRVPGYLMEEVNALKAEMDVLKEESKELAAKEATDVLREKHNSFMKKFGDYRRLINIIRTQYPAQLFKQDKDGNEYFYNPPWKRGYIRQNQWRGGY